MTSVMASYREMLDIAAAGPEFTVTFIPGELPDVIGHGYRFNRTIDVPDGRGGSTRAIVTLSVVALGLNSIHEPLGLLDLTADLSWTGPSGPHQSMAHYIVSDSHARALARDAGEPADAIEHLEQSVGDLLANRVIDADLAAILETDEQGDWDQTYPGYADGARIRGADEDEVNEASRYHGHVIRSVVPTYAPLCLLSWNNSGSVNKFTLPTLFHWVREAREVATT